MTDPQPSPAPLDSWEAILEAMRRRYPGQKDSVLFCIHKLQQNPDLTMRDFRDEAKLYGIPVAGRALHSAKGLLGLIKVPAVEPAFTAAPVSTRRHRVSEPDDNGSIETRVMSAVRQIQSAAGAQSDQMRAAIREAITILQRALDN